MSTTRKIRISRQQFEKLTDLPTELRPVGEHLSDEEFAAYAAKVLSESEAVRLDAHLAACTECCEEVERLLTATSAWLGVERKTQTAEVHERAESTPGLRQGSNTLLTHVSQILSGAQLWRTFGLQGAHARTTKTERGDVGLEIAGVPSEAHYLIEEDGTGNLHIWVSSYEMTWEGHPVRLHAGAFKRDLRFQRVASDQVGFETVISTEERLNVSAETQLTIEPPEAA